MENGQLLMSGLQQRAKTLLDHVSVEKQLNNEELSSLTGRARSTISEIRNERKRYGQAVLNQDHPQAVGVPARGPAAHLPAVDAGKHLCRLPAGPGPADGHRRDGLRQDGRAQGLFGQRHRRCITSRSTRR